MKQAEASLRRRPWNVRPVPRGLCGIEDGYRFPKTEPSALGSDDISAYRDERWCAATGPADQQRYAPRLPEKPVSGPLEAGVDALGALNVSRQGCPWLDSPRLHTSGYPT